jgi:hypothetical protein
MTLKSCGPGTLAAPDAVRDSELNRGPTFVQHQTQSLYGYNQPNYACIKRGAESLILTMFVDCTGATGTFCLPEQWPLYSRRAVC